jgi:hypothetical protein
MEKSLIILSAILFFSCSQMKLQDDYSVSGVENPVLCLSGTWQFAQNPVTNFWELNSDTSGWKDILVPGEASLQGFKIEQEKEYAYKKWIEIPEDFKDKKITIHFEGVYSFARVWVNGRFVCDHYCGFTPWDCDITQLAKPGEKALLVVGFTDKKKDISMESFYAHHNIGGILRDVSLIASPKNNIASIHINTDLDDQYKNAVLKISSKIEFTDAGSAKIRYSLYDKEGNKTDEPVDVEVKKGSPETTTDIAVNNPLKWDEEHPNLYILKTELFINDKSQEIISNNIGFREIEIRKNQFLVNGQEVKIRGFNHHMIHPLLGRADDNAFAERDIQFCKEANVNFLRTSHYPPSKKFLELCDKYGLYIESETAVVWQDSTAKDSTYFPEYLAQLGEMIELGRNHPSVILWSIGNENQYGPVFKKSYDYAKQLDSTRPVIFSYGMTALKKAKCYDVFSVHYSNYDGTFNWIDHRTSLGSDTIPTLHDEYGPVAQFLFPLFNTDESVRDYYGASIDTFWCQMYDNPGCLGGAIWAMVDENFFLKDTAVGYGHWGFVDVWRRPKPELWNMKKAYSPIRVSTKIIDPSKTKTLKIHNRFNHTSLKELKCTWKIGDENGILNLPDVGPHKYAEVALPQHTWKNGDKMLIQFFRNTFLIDEELITTGHEKYIFAEEKKSKLDVKEDSKSIVVSSDDFSLTFDKQKGLLISGNYKNEKIIESGPYIYFGPYYKFKGWKAEQISCQKSLDTVTVGISGKSLSFGEEAIPKAEWYKFQFRYNDKTTSTDVKFIIKICSSGNIITQYSIPKPPDGYTEVGVRYVLSSTIEKYKWERKGLWTTYPQDHLGALSGECSPGDGVNPVYGKTPENLWIYDRYDPFVTGPKPKEYYINACKDTMKNVSRIFKSMKQNIWYVSFINKEKNRLRIISDATESVRTEIKLNGDWNVYLINQFSYAQYFKYGNTGNEWGNYVNKFLLPKDYKASVKMCFAKDDKYEIAY